jgi:hypothetical protein
LTKDSDHLSKLQSLEFKKKAPLFHCDPEFIALETKWIYETGLHVGISRGADGLLCIIFMVKIRYVKFFFISH